MKLDQLCIFAVNEDAVLQAMATLNLEGEPWIYDNVKGRVSVMDRHGEWHYGESSGTLRFNYSTGMEIEILTYDDEMNWHTLHNANEAYARMGHVGYHLAKDEDWPEHLSDKMVQELMTYEHTNPQVIAAGRTYHYRIYDTVAELGYYTKVIRRLGKDQE